MSDFVRINSTISLQFFGKWGWGKMVSPNNIGVKETRVVITRPAICLPDSPTMSRAFWDIYGVFPYYFFHYQPFY
uniref:Uncharacterized protein n=1 Tax=Picea glauca TaxID=3330 RepID=A0A101LWN1_PICGL|nr:hypothetical protein ABT39_MTgene1417 [Picea glauca]QHR92402.1 hypothetical protein Q903MT_gene6445 [Picea sitchensis]